MLRLGNLRREALPHVSIPHSPPTPSSHLTLAFHYSTQSSTQSPSQSASASVTASQSPSPSSTPSMSATQSPPAVIPFSYNGNFQYFTVPPNVTSIGITMWGAGGGGAGFVALGGAGAFVSGNLPVTPGETLRIVVGRGGPYKGSPGNAAQGNGGGGWSLTVLNPSFFPGAGGGRSAVQRRISANAYGDIVTAGGGGGGGGYNAGGGAGGILQGRRGGDQAMTRQYGHSPIALQRHLTSSWGGGGGQVAGGVGRYKLAPGLRFLGGSSWRCVRDQCGGGGGGWFGGAAGDDGPGGGGSSYVASLSDVVAAAGFADAPGIRDESPYYVPGTAVGGQPQTRGGHGLVVITYSAAGIPWMPSIQPSPTESKTGTTSRTSSKSPSTTRTGSKSPSASRSGSKSPSASRSGVLANRVRTYSKSGTNTVSRSRRATSPSHSRSATRSAKARA